MTTIDDVIERIPEWHGREVRAVPLTGGLTNTNYRVEVGGARYVVRIPGASTELLAVNREHEYHNTLAAASTGVGARLAHYLPDIPVMVLEFIDGPTMTSARLREPEQIARIAASVRALHAGPAFANTFNMFRTMDFYLEIVARHGFRIPDGYIAHRLVDSYHLVRPKTEKGQRTIPIVPWMHDALVQWRDDSKPNDHDLVWPGQYGRPMREETHRAAWRDLSAAAGVPAHDLYSCRHTTVTLLTEAGVHPSVIRAIVGHASDRSTRAYTHVQLKSIRDALDGLATTLKLTSS